ncbi:MAG TPA: TetR/AcrR family transcriptional regulator [Solirubrobacterales bacterium]|nr:TetR/AcrR family transcriptional regulator [Solirubrobacterales bacterium]
MTATRTYRQTRRADATERTRATILAAAQAAFRADPGGDPSLEDVAERAGVSARTVIRQFGSKGGLMTAAIEGGMAASATDRRVAPGDVEAAVRKLADHYEADGDEVMLWLSLAERLPHVRRITERGTEMHVEWVEEVFAADLDGLPRVARRARVGALATALDVYTWHLLRRREGLGREATRGAMRALVEGARAAGAAVDSPPGGGAGRAAEASAR